MSKMMKCGHAANAVDRSGKPTCAICIGINEGATTVAPDPDLADRNAKCIYCSKTKPSSTKLAFFEHRSQSETDSFYCGCYGWN